MDSFVDRLSPAELQALRERARPQRFPRGGLLMAERQLGDRVLILIRGRVKVSRATPAGRDAVLGFRGAGELVGELAALDGQPRSGTVTALEQVDALAIADDVFRGFLET